MKTRNLPSCAALCLSHSVIHLVFSSSFFFFLENTTIPNLREVKENMTMGSTLVTNPKGGFLVSRKSSTFSIDKKKKDWSLHICCKTTQQRIYRTLTKPLASMEKSGSVSWERNRMLWINCGNVEVFKHVGLCLRTVVKLYLNLRITNVSKLQRQ